MEGKKHGDSWCQGEEEGKEIQIRNIILPGRQELEVSLCPTLPQGESLTDKTETKTENFHISMLSSPFVTVTMGL